MRVDLKIKESLTSTVVDNFSRVKPYLFFVPLFILSIIAFFLYSKNALSVAKYVDIQKEYFYYINSKLSVFPDFIYNLTQMGNAFIFLSIVSILVIYAPKVWEALLSASIVSALLTNVLKKLFEVPRPAAILDHSTFTIIGEKLTGNNSLPSGHSITIFTMLTVLFFSFMPKNKIHKIAWSFFMVYIGLLLVFTRVGLGAHYPLDVIIGGLIGAICGISGIIISQKYPLWSWITAKKHNLICTVLFIVGIAVIANKIINSNLIIYYFTLICLLFSLYTIISSPRQSALKSNNSAEK